MGTVFARLTGELDEGFDAIALAVMVLVAQSLEGGSLGSFACGKETAADAEESLAVF